MIFCFLCDLESGNPGGLPATYSGTVSDFSNADSVIFRPPLVSDEQQPQQQQQEQQHPDAVNDYRLLRTEQDSRWLNGNWRCSAFNRVEPTVAVQPSFFPANSNVTKSIRTPAILVNLPFWSQLPQRWYFVCLPNLLLLIYVIQVRFRKRHEKFSQDD